MEGAVSGTNFADSRQYADKLRAKLAQVPALRDLAFEQELDYPTVKVTVDRERAGVLGVKTGDVANSLVAGTSSSRFIPLQIFGPIPRAASAIRCRSRSRS